MPEMKARLSTLGIELAGNSPEEFAARIEAGNLPAGRMAHPLQ
jgi:hypothetical protein